MTEAMTAADAAADFDGAVASVMDDIRSNPAALAPRLALFQLACVAGDWVRAGKQLDALEGLDAETALMSKVYRGLIEAEEKRRAVLAGAEPPMSVGRPPPWFAMLAQALAFDARGEAQAAADLRARALDAAEPSAGHVFGNGPDGTPFAWIMDADPRFGPTLEVIVDGAYRWLPLVHLQELRSDPPADVKDLVWLPARLTLTGGGEAHAFLPVRYPGSEACVDAALRMARATEWRDAAGGVQVGLGQRLLATDAGDHPLLDIRRLVVEAPHG